MKGPRQRSAAPVTCRCRTNPTASANTATTAPSLAGAAPRAVSNRQTIVLIVIIVVALLASGLAGAELCPSPR